MAGLLAGRQLGMPKCRSSCRSSHAGANPAFRAALPRSQLLRPLNRNVRMLGSGTESSKPACSAVCQANFRPRRPDAVAGLPRPTEAGCLAAAASPFGPTTRQSFWGARVLREPYRARTFATSAEALPTAEYFRRPLGDWMADTGGLGREPSSSRRVLPSSIARRSWPDRAGEAERCNVHQPGTISARIML